MDTEGFVLFKGGYLVDGTGSKGFTGDLLIKGDTIEQVSREPIQIDCHTYGAFPLLLQYARDRNLLSVEEAVHKMTGASAERFKLDSRGILRKGFAADITIFDWNRVKDNCTVSQTDQAPDGIEAVFMNGRQVKADGKVDGSLTVGLVVS